MKRKISVILVAILLAVSAFALVACGGVKTNLKLGKGSAVTQEEWNAAMEYYKTADVVSIKINDNEYNRNNIYNRKRYVSEEEVVFNAEKGFVMIYVKQSARGFVGVDWNGPETSHSYYVLDGTKLLFRSNHLTTINNGWSKADVWIQDKPKVEAERATEEEAMELLRLRYLRLNGGNFCELKYEDFTQNSDGNYVFQTTTSKGFTTIHTLSFAQGKVVGYSYSSEDERNERETTLVISYSSKVTLPKDFYDAK